MRLQISSPWLGQLAVSRVSSSRGAALYQRGAFIARRVISPSRRLSRSKPIS